MTITTTAPPTAVGNDSNGAAVMRRTRRVSQVNGFGRVSA